MTTRLEGPLKREIDIDGAPYTLTLSPEGMTLVQKGKRKGFEMRWTALVNGDAALATALNASLTANLRSANTASTARTQKSVDHDRPRKAARDKKH